MRATSRSSQDLAAALLLLGATAAVWVGGSTMLGQGQVLLGQVLDSGFISDPVTPDGAWPMVRTLGAAGLRIAAPAVLIVWTAGILAQLLQIGWLFSPKSLAPKLSKLNPLDGAKRIFGLSGLVKVSLDSLKVLRRDDRRRPDHYAVRDTHRPAAGADADGGGGRRWQAHARPGPAGAGRAPPARASSTTSTSGGSMPRPQDDASSR